MNRIAVSPSILAADFSNLAKEIELVESGGADYIHLDIMDGNFVPNISFGLDVLRAIRKSTKLPLDVHLMVSNPGQYIPNFVSSGADIISIHYESVVHLDRTVGMIKDSGAKVGLALNPATSENVLEYILDKLDLVLVMTVNPGFVGQKFLDGQLKKIEKIKKMINNTNVKLEVDGGINDKNAKAVISAGADILVAGSYIFKSGDYERAIRLLKNY